MVNSERELQVDSTESRIIEFGLDFAEKLKIEVEEISGRRNHEIDLN